MFDTVVGTAAEAFNEHALPWLGKKAVEMGRYGASELMRNKNLQKKAVNYGINKLTPFIQDSVGSAMDQLSTKVRPKKRYKTNRKDLDGAAWSPNGSGLQDKITNFMKSGVFGSPYQVDLKKGYEILTDPGLFAPVYKIPKEEALAKVKYYKDEYKKAKANGYSKSYNSFVKEMGWGAGTASRTGGGDPMTVVKKAPDIAMSTTQELIPSLKPVYDRYKSGDIMKSAFGSDHGITSSKFWRRPTAAEEKKMGIVKKSSNPELFFKFEKPSRRMKKTRFFENNPEALEQMNNIISSNPDTWPQVLRAQYGIIVDEHFWENNPLLSFGSGTASRKRYARHRRTGGASRTKGSGDIHKWIGKLPKPKAGWTPGKYKYMGPYNPLEKQLTYDPETGEVTEWRVKPYNKVDEIAAYHDICYDMGRNKGDCDREMVKSLDQIPYGEMPKWGSQLDS